MIKSPFRRQKSQGDDSVLQSPDKTDDFRQNENKLEVASEGPETKVDDAPLPPPILTIQTDDKNSSAIIEAINLLQATMVQSHLNLERKMDTKLTSVEGQLKLLNNKLRDQDKVILDLRRNMADVNSLKQIEESLTNVASQADQKFVEIDRDLVAMRTELDAYRLENLRLGHRMFEAEEKLSLQAIRSKKLNFTLEGLPQKGKSKWTIKTTLIGIINEGQKTKLTEDDYAQAYRQGAFNANSTKPQPVSLVLKDDNACNVFLRARGKLAKTSVWINEDLPATYRRRKSMLRDLVKVAKQKKYHNWW